VALNKLVRKNRCLKHCIAFVVEIATRQVMCNRGLGCHSVLNCGCLFCCEGKSGLDELHVMIRKSNSGRHADVNERFHQFAGVLFSTCVDFERSIQTREVNDKLDRVIRSFLIEISGYLYMKPTRTSPPHKALEWLVHRFCFIMCITMSTFCKYWVFSFSSFRCCF